MMCHLTSNLLFPGQSIDWSSTQRLFARWQLGQRRRPRDRCVEAGVAVFGGGGGVKSQLQMCQKIIILKLSSVERWWFEPTPKQHVTCRCFCYLSMPVCWKQCDNCLKNGLATSLPRKAWNMLNLCSSRMFCGFPTAPNASTWWSPCEAATGGIKCPREDWALQVAGGVEFVNSGSRLIKCFFIIGPFDSASKTNQKQLPIHSASPCNCLFHLISRYEHVIAQLKNDYMIK